MYSARDDPNGPGFPIRKSADQRSLSSPRGLSQSATSFIASWRQGIHQMPFSHLSLGDHVMHRDQPPKKENQTPPMPLAQQLAVVTQCHRPERPVRPLTEPSHQSERRPIQQTTHRLSGMRPMDARSSSPSQRTGPWNQGPMATTQTRVFQDRRPRGMPCRAWPVWWSRPGSNR